MILVEKIKIPTVIVSNLNLKINNKKIVTMNKNEKDAYYVVKVFQGNVSKKEQQYPEYKIMTQTISEALLCKSESKKISLSEVLVKGKENKNIKDILLSETDKQVNVENYILTYKEPKKKIILVKKNK